MRMILATLCVLFAGTHAAVAAPAVEPVVSHEIVRATKEARPSSLP
jgi:hypothetical protein